MIKIYFDGEEIDELYYAGLKKSAQLFSSSFLLGKTICETYEIKIGKDAPNIGFNVNEVKIYDDNKLIKTLYVDSIKEEKYAITYNLVDAMIKFNFQYDASAIIGDSSVKLKDIFNDICQKAGINSDITEFDSDDIDVSWYDNSFLARDYLGYIAELNASSFYINEENKLALKPIVQDAKKEISFDEISDYEIGEVHEFSRVVFDNGENVWSYGTEEKETYYINTSNVYLINEQQVENIFNKINGLKFYNFRSNNIPIEDLQVADYIVFKYNDVEYPTYVQFENIDYIGGNWIGGLSLSVNTEQQEETKVVGDKERIKAIQITVNRDANKITQLITQTNELDIRTTDNETEINNNYQELIQKFGDFITDDEFVSYKEQMQTELSDSQYQITNIESIIADGVNIVKTTSGTFDDKGLTMEQSGANTKTILNQDGVDVKDVNGSVSEDLLYAGYVSDEKAQQNEELASYKGQTVVFTKNIVVKNYLMLGTYSRVEDYEDGTGIFYIG